MIDRPLRVAFIGAGQMARHHLNALKRLEVPTVVVGVHDRALGRGEEFAVLAGTQAFPSAHALLAETRPDVVHVCTPPGAHFEAAYTALIGGAHVYVEKPFALTAGDAQALLDLAGSRRLLVCAGHQLLRDRAFEMLAMRAADLGTLVQVDSHFAFRPVGAAARAGAGALAEQVVDILPHPLYTLVAVLERFALGADGINLAWVHAGPADLQGILCTGEVVGRLSVSLRARPVASSLTLTGTRGSLTCDFVRSVVVGTANPGTEALEKVLNPMVEGVQLFSRTAFGVARRMRSGAGYPGLAELIEAFYRAVVKGDASPVPPEHLLRVTALFEDLVAKVRGAARRSRPCGPSARRPSHAAPLAVLTGARGFLGAEIARALHRVRGIVRAAPPEGPDGHEWVAADLSNGLPADALAGAEVVVHAAAETGGGYEAHQRNTIDATHHLLRAMHAAGVSRLVLVSSLSVLRPPCTPWERQDERTPRPKDPRPLGPYVWGKCLQEELVEREAPALGIATRIVRPGALVDWNEPALPGVMGRRLFGHWHLGLGRPGLPIAVCDVKRCAETIAWCASHFDEAPAIVNLFEPTVTTRGALVARLRARGWTGRILWVPSSVVALGFLAVRAVRLLVCGRLTARLAAWSIVRPRRYDARLAAVVLEAARWDGRAVRAVKPAVYG